MRTGLTARQIATSVAVVMAAATAGCASMSGAEATKAPEPAKPIDVARFYTGRWYEIARTPMSLTKDCVAGTTDYAPARDGRIIDTDACRMGSPAGPVKTFAGQVDILNPGMNTKVRVTYVVFGLLPAPRTYWMLDHGDDYGWFIVSDPAFKNLSLFTRSPRPSADEVAQVKARAQALGYDTAKLEYPAQFPAGAR